MSSLTELREKYNRLKSIIDTDLNDWNPATVKSMVSQQNNASRDLPGVLYELTQAVANNSLTIKLNESVNKRLDLIEALATKQGDNVVTIDFYSLEKRLLDRCSINVKNEFYEFNTEFVQKVNRELYFVMSDLAIQSLPIFQTPANTLGGVNGYTTSLKKLESMLVKNYDQELKNHYINKDLMDAVKDKYQYDKVIILLTNVPDNVSNDVKVSNRSLTVSMNKIEDAIIVNDDTTLDSLLKSIKNKVNKK